MCEMHIMARNIVDINVRGQRRSEDYTGMQRGQARFFTYYRFLALRRHCSVGFPCVYTSRFQEIQKRFIEILKNCKMVNFCTMHGKKASFLGGYELLCVLRCVHCVSKQPLILISEGLPCDELECREVHVHSSTDSSKNSPLSSCG
jgi:hypothetical protein